MLRSRLILIASILALVFVILTAVMMTKKDGSESQQAEHVDESGVPQELSQSPDELGAVVGSVASKKDAKLSGTGKVSGDVAALSPGASGAASGSTSPVAETPKTSAPCQVAQLKSDVKDLKGHLNEFRLERNLGASEPLCVTVDGKSVAHTRLKDGRVRIDSRIAKNSSKVAAVFCSEGVKCQLHCAEPEKDFWDTIGSDDALAAGPGFADAESAQDKELQKEMKALKDVLSRKPVEAPVAMWAIASVSDSSCK